jgi:hypothetical protein
MTSVVLPNIVVWSSGNTVLVWACIVGPPMVAIGKRLAFGMIAVAGAPIVAPAGGGGGGGGGAGMKPIPLPPPPQAASEVMSSEAAYSFIDLAIVVMLSPIRCWEQIDFLRAPAPKLFTV